MVGPANDVSCANDMALYQGMDFSGRARQRCQLCKRYGFVSGHGLQWSASPTMSAVQTIWLCIRVRASVVGPADDVSCANDMALYQGTGFSGRPRQRCQLCKRYGLVSGHGLQWSASPTMSAVQTIWLCIRARLQPGHTGPQMRALAPGVLLSCSVRTLSQSRCHHDCELEFGSEPVVKTCSACPADTR